MDMLGGIFQAPSRNNANWPSGAARDPYITALWEMLLIDEPTDNELFYKAAASVSESFHLANMSELVRRETPFAPGDWSFLHKTFVFRIYFLDELRAEPTWKRWCAIARIDTEKLIQYYARSMLWRELPAIHATRSTLETAFREVGARPEEVKAAVIDFFVYADLHT